LNRPQALSGALVALEFAALVAGLAAASLALDTAAHGLWRGYLTLVTGEGVDYRGALARLGVRTWVDAREAKAAFTVFHGLEQVRVADLEGRFDPLDPRFDPYMRSLGAWFDAGGGWSVAYVRLDRPAPLLTAGLLVTLPGYGSRWSIADRAPAAGIVSLIAAALLVVVFGMARPQDRAATAAMALALAGWAPALSRGSPFDLAVFLLLATSWARGLAAALDAARAALAPGGAVRMPPPPRLAPFGAAAALAVAARLAAGASLPALAALAALAAIFPAATLLAVAVERAGASTRPHPVFQPLRLVSRRGDEEPAPRSVRLLGLLPLGLAVAALALGTGRAPHLRVPAPDRIAGARSYTWPVLERLWTEGAASPLPDLADYVVHIAYQEALPYGRPYGFPVGDVVLPTYAAGRGPRGVQGNDELVIRYDDFWLSRALGDPVAGSVERLLLDQRSPVRVKYRSLGDASPGLLLWNGLLIALCGALVLFPLGTGGVLLRPGGASDRPR
jgi:hypothetical protein